MNKLLKLLNIEKEETKSVALLMSLSLFLGFYNGTFDISATAIFLDTFDETVLPKAFLISGLAGVIITLLYTKLQSKIEFSRLAFYNILFIGVTILFLRLSYIFVDQEILAFLLLVMMGPLNIISIVGFWGVASRLFSLRQGKRLFSLVDSGQIFGVILSSFAIPIFLNYWLTTKDLLFVAAISIFIASILQLNIGKKFNLNTVVSTPTTKKAASGLKILFNDKYIFMMSLFVVLSMISAFFIYFSFLSVSNSKYPDSTELAKFLGVFTGLLMAFSFIIKTFVYSKLAKTYNLKILFLILPILLGIFTILSSIVGSIYGYSASSSSFVFFFILIALSRLFSVSLKMSIESPSLKLLYQSLNKDIRFDIQAKIDGVVNEFAALFSGVLLAILGILGFSLLHYTYVLLIVLIAWSVVTIILFIEYKKSLHKTLSNTKDNTKSKPNSEKNIRSILINSLNNADKQRIFELINITKQTSFYLHNELLKKLALTNNHNDNEEILDIIKNAYLFELLKTKTSYNSRFYNKIIAHYSNILDNNIHNIKILASSKNKNDRFLAANLYITIEKIDNKDMPFIGSLLRDFEKEVKYAAISTISTYKKNVFVSYLLEQLSILEDTQLIENALVEIGENILEYLDSYFYSLNVSDKIRLKVIDIVGNIGGKKAIEFLIANINNNNRNIVKQAALGLQKCKYKFQYKDINEIRQAIELNTYIIAWNLTSIISLLKFDENSDLVLALKKENKYNYNLLFLLLSLEYDAQSINLIRENIESETTESIGFALELMEVFIAEELKPKIFALIDLLSDSDRILLFQEFYPLFIKDKDEVTIDIINRNVNHLNVWTRATALVSFSKSYNPEHINVFIAQLFSPDKIIREAAGYVMYKNNFEEYSRVNRRLNRDIKKELDISILQIVTKTEHLIFEKVKYLKKLILFNKLSDTLLVKFSGLLSELYIDEGFEIADTLGATSYLFYFVIDGEITLYDKNQIKQKSYKNNDIIGGLHLQSLIDDECTFIADKNTSLYCLNGNEVFALSYRNVELFDLILSININEFENDDRL